MGGEGKVGLGGSMGERSVGCGVWWLVFSGMVGMVGIFVVGGVCLWGCMVVARVLVAVVEWFLLCVWFSGFLCCGFVGLVWWFCVCLVLSCLL